MCPSGWGPLRGYHASNARGQRRKAPSGAKDFGLRLRQPEHLKKFVGGAVGLNYDAINMDEVSAHPTDAIRSHELAGDGNRSRNLRPGALSTISILASWSRATAATRLRPSPLPGVRRLRSSR